MPFGRNARDVSLCPPYAAAGFGVPYMTTDAATHAAALRTGTARKAAIRLACRVRSSRTTMKAPSRTASTAKRVCIHGSAARAAPCQIHGLTPDSEAPDRSRRRSAQNAVRTIAAPGASGYTVKLSRRKGAASATLAQPNHAAATLVVAHHASHHASADAAADPITRNTPTPW